jgi:4-methylaminobutanoate oxidase (formaldehyde-forming)
VHRDGAEVGYVRAASYGWTVGGAVGLAMVESGGAAINQAWLDDGEWSVQIGDRIVPARASLRPLYDPSSKRIRM